MSTLANDWRELKVFFSRISGRQSMILSQKVCAGRIRTNAPTPGYNIQPLFRILPQHTVALRCAKSLELPQNGFLRGNQSMSQDNETIGSEHESTGDKISDEERKERLARRIANEMVRTGCRVESQSEFQVVLVKGHRVNHLLHLILTLLTFGCWLIVWLIVAVNGGEKRKSISIDRWGNFLINS